MAFPTVVGTGIWTGTGTGSGTFQTYARCPAGIVAGDIILVFWMRNTATGLGGLDAAFTDLGSAGSNSRAVRVAYKVADGSEAGADVPFVTLTNVTSDSGTITIVLRGTTGAPEALVAVMVAGTTSDPPSLTPTFGSGDTMWIAGYYSNAAANSLVSVPASYGNSVENNYTGKNIDLAIARRNLVAATEDPGTFTVAVSGTTHAVTVAIEGAVTAAGRAFGTVVG